MRSFKSKGLITFMFSVAILARGANPLPTATPDFQVIATDGVPVSSTKIIQPGNWILVYLKPNCASCDRFLRVLGQTGGPGFASHVIVIVGGATSGKVAQMSSAFPDLASASWYADAPEAGIAALQINVMPVIFGVHASTLSWSIIGIPSGDSMKLKAILKSWISG
jgi:hypothetical protein